MTGAHGNRLDAAIAADVEQALHDNEVLRGAGLRAHRVEVRDGVVTLRGHMADQTDRRLAEAAARRVPGVLDVRDEIVADDDLEIAVAQALAADPRTRPHHIQVHAAQGIVYLAGAVPSDDVRRAAEAVAAAVPGVRTAVIQLAAPGAPARSSPVILPRIGVEVSAADGLVGTLDQVVIDPRSRRVTHLVVSGRFPPAGLDNAPPGTPLAAKRLLVPAELVHAVTETAVLLHSDVATAAGLPEYDPEIYTAPGGTWAPPIDYDRDNVRLARESVEPHGMHHEGHHAHW